MEDEATGLRSGSSTGLPAGSELAIIGEPATPERADAARNRMKVLEAAGRLFRAQGVRHVSMDDIARAAGVGKGTLYRRFGDKSGLAQALLGERERELQRAMIQGPPPLGPGAAPAERLVAFATTYAHFVVSHLDLVLMSETATPGIRPRIGANQLWRLHCRRLFEDAGAAHPQLFADSLLASMAAEQVEYWVSDADSGRRAAELPSWVIDGLASMCRNLANGPGPAPTSA